MEDSRISQVMVEEELFEEDIYDDDELPIQDLEELEQDEEEENMGHRLITSNPENDGDSDYFFNERYFEQ